MFPEKRPLHLFISLILLLGYHAGIAQQSNFLHIQSENSQPYLVQWNGNNFHSSQSGYLVIPKVPAGDQSMVISFPANEFSGYSFKYTMTAKAKGFALKLALDNSWSLFDMVDFSVIKGTAVSPDDKTALVKPDETKKENVAVKVTADKTGADTKSLSGIEKIFDKASAGGTDQVYIVNNDGKMDTVAIFIPVLVTGQVKPVSINGAVAETLAFIDFPVLYAREMYVTGLRKPVAFTLFSNKR